MIKESCNCFTCRHRDEPRVVAGYLQGYIEASDWFINWAERNKIKLGSIADDDLGGIYAQMKCNRDESGCLLEEFPDLEKPIENLEAENQRLKIKNNKMKRLLKDLDYWLGQELNLNYFKGEIMSFVLTKEYIMEEKKKKIEEVLKKVEE